jgi:cyclophilin family peptidyl-prolyl cis-trans isomerase
VGTAKRERQKAGRQARLEAQEAEQATAKRKRTIIRGAILLVAFLAVAFIISRLVAGNDDNTAVSSGTTVAAGADSTGAGTTGAGAPTTAGGSAGTTAAASTASTITTVPGTSITGATPCPPTDGSAERVTSFEQAPPMCIDPAKKYTADVETNHGSFTIELDPKAAPNTVNNFVVLSLYHYYDGITCHRVVADFVIQCGDPKGDGTGGPGYEFADELPAEGAYQLGSLAMANSGPDTNGSQFFIISGDQGTQLPAQYSLFGQVTDGLDTTIKTIAGLAVPGADGPPSQPVQIQKVTITES